MDWGHLRWKKERPEKEEPNEQEKSHDQSKIGPQVYFWKGFERRNDTCYSSISARDGYVQGKAPEFCQDHRGKGIPVGI